MTITPFHYRAAEGDLEDLRRRLASTRWPPEGPGADPWEDGFALRELQSLCRRWREEFDWRAAERAIERWPQFLAEIGSYRIHFLHVRGRRRGGLPLILTHGWPGSFLEFLPVIPMLEEFDLVIPSLPGFGFSRAPAEPGCNTFVIAALWAELMRGLGYERYGAQGGDFGAAVSTILGWKYPERVAGVHLNYIPGSYRPDLSAGPPPSAEEQAFLAEVARWEETEGAYAHLQRTRPGTLSYGLNDSPAGLAAWILECFRNWADCGGLESRFAMHALANLTLYWLTGCIGAACRLYRETARAPLAFGPGERVRVPTAVAHFPREAPFPPRSWVERGYALARWTEMPSGGHFAALEEPERLTADVAAFFAQRS